MKIGDYISLGSLIATIIIGILSWVVSAHLTKKNIKHQELSYTIKMYPIVSKEFLRKSSDIRIYYQDEILPEPTLLAIDIINSGNVAIENPPIEIEAIGATYVIPGYIEDIPPGYEELWSLERSDAESCFIKLSHINAGQVVKARFFLDEFPNKMPIFKCAMKDLKVKEVNTEVKEVILNGVARVVVQSILSIK